MRASRLFEELNLCHADGSFRKRLAAIAKVGLLVIRRVFAGADGLVRLVLVKAC